VTLRARVLPAAALPRPPSTAARPDRGGRCPGGPAGAQPAGGDGEHRGAGQRADRRPVSASTQAAADHGESIQGGDRGLVPGGQQRGPVP
jgi:hypothetical protein